MLVRTTAGRAAVLRRAAGRGALAGLAGVAVMTAGEKAEQAVTSRPDSFVPARALRALFGRRPGDSERPPAWNLAMHYGTGAALGALRGIWAAVGLRGARAHLAHTVTRLSFDQTVENVTGVGAPPRTWPPREEAVDVAHKAVYSLVTGLLAERWVRPELESARGRTTH